MIIMQQIPLVDLKAEYHSIKNEIDSAIGEVIEKTQFINGPLLERFEKNFAIFCNAKYCIGTSNGTSSLYCALKALGLKANDEVITVANTFIATTEAVSLANGRVRLVDVNERNYNMDIKKLKAAITGKTKAIIPVHLYGQPVDMDPIYELAEEKGLFVVEDAAQAHGAKYKNKIIGSRGIVSFSFFPAKILGCFGDGGALVVNDKEIAEKIRLETDHGRMSKYEHLKEGFNFRLDTLQANILNAKLPHLESWVKKRRELAKAYDELLPEEIIRPYEEEYANHSYYMYVIRAKRRDKLMEFLKTKGISCGIHYPIPLHKQPAYKGMFNSKFPIAEKTADEILSIPLYPLLKEEQQQYICSSIKEFYRNN
jgi:dTDP-4-amino-4,6-dideoxygalactose transaminase